DGTAGAVDVEVDVLLRIVGRQEQELGDDGIGHLVGDGRSQENDAVEQQAGVDVVRALPAVRLFDDHRDVVHGGPLLEKSSFRIVMDCVQKVKDSQTLVIKNKQKNAANICVTAREWKNWRARRESNPDLRLRRPASYPLDHGRPKNDSVSYYRRSGRKKQGPAVTQLKCYRTGFGSL